ncbi:MAG: TIGR03943 family putative permease subunit [Chthoniobacterales bacterium]|jgi:uncharacterized repeat protein (TIGR03943 family)
MNRRTLTLVTLLLWGGLMVWFWASGRIVSYLHPQFHVLVAGAGTVLLLLAPAWWWATREITAGCGDCGCHHGHEAEPPRGALGAGAVFAFVVLLLPVSAAMLVSPSQFGEAAVMNRGIVSSISQLPAAGASVPGDLEGAPMLDEGEELPDVYDWPEEEEEGVEYYTRGPDGAIQLETIDLLFAAEEPGLRDEFDNQRVSIVGQYVPSRGPGATFDLVRMMMVCCAADARPVGVEIETAQPRDFPRMGWIRVTGPVRFVESGGLREPRVTAEQIEEIPAPRETILY